MSNIKTPLEGSDLMASIRIETDCHDAEMMIISCNNAYCQVASEYLEEEKRASFPKESILASIAFIGGLR